MLLVVRHGRTESNARGLLLGRLDPALDDLGRRQAVAVAGALGPVDRVVSSPLVRTRATAEAIAAGSGVGVEVDERFIELDYGDWDGRPVGSVGPDDWRRWRADLEFCPPGGESLAALGGRVRDGVEALAPDAAGGATVVVVTHVSPVKAVLAWALGVGDEVCWRAFVAPASITRVAVDGRGPALHAFNETGHLAGL